MMKLEDEIKQESFKSAYHKLNVNFLYTYNWLQFKKKDLFNDFDITPQQYNVLRILKGKMPEPCSTSFIRERMLDKMSDASRIVDRLVKKKYADRKTCRRDKRLVDIVIIKQGLELLDKMESAVMKSEDLLKNLSVQEAQVMNFLLDKLRG